MFMITLMMLLVSLPVVVVLLQLLRLTLLAQPTSHIACPEPASLNNCI